MPREGAGVLGAGPSGAVAAPVGWGDAGKEQEPASPPPSVPPGPPGGIARRCPREAACRCQGRSRADRGRQHLTLSHPSAHTRTPEGQGRARPPPPPPPPPSRPRTPPAPASGSPGVPGTPRARHWDGRRGRRRIRRHRAAACTARSRDAPAGSSARRSTAQHDSPEPLRSPVALRSPEPQAAARPRSPPPVGRCGAASGAQQRVVPAAPSPHERRRTLQPGLAGML